METVLLSFVVFGLCMAAMAVGVMFKRKPLAGSCGGLSAFTKGECEICGGDPAKCETRNGPT